MFMFNIDNQNMAYNARVDSFRKEEYPNLNDKTYLDHGGTTLYARSLIEDFSRKMVSNLYGNPHSKSDPAQLSSHVVDSTRAAALAFFGADPEHFDLIFTANATAAIKLVGESFQDLAVSGTTSRSFFYGYHRDAHTSIVGVRELTTGGTHHCFTTDKEVEEWLDGSRSTINTPNAAGLPGLFAYPGQSNMTGRRLPLSWPGKLRHSDIAHHQNTYSLLDAAALATTTQLDLSDPDTAPDFTTVSFYKIFGFPDLGALIVRKKSGHILSWRRYFGGGTVDMLTVLNESTVQRKTTSLHDALEDGTLPFHNILALSCAIDVHEKLYGSMKQISQHTSFLVRRLYNGMTTLTHHNGIPVCVIHNDVEEMYPYEDPTTQGSTVAFSVIRSDGTYVGHSVVEKLANDEGIYLRAGGLCNAGGISNYLKVEPWQFKRAWSAGHRCGEGALELINGKPTGVVRASLGAMSILADVDTVLEFLATTFQSQAEYVPALPAIAPLEGSLESHLIRSIDSGYHSRGSSAANSPIMHPSLKQASSQGNLRSPMAETRLLRPQQSFYAGVGRHDQGRFVNRQEHYDISSMPPVPIVPIHACDRRPLAEVPRSIAMSDLNRYAEFEVPRPQAFNTSGKESAGDGSRAKRSKFKFWKAKRSDEILASGP